MSSPPASPGRKGRSSDPKTAANAAANSAKSTGRKPDPVKPAPPGKPKTKKELEQERLALEEAERNKPPQTGSGVFEFPNGAVYDGEWQLFEDGVGKKRHGQGRFTNGGEVYVGQWKEGNIAGKGKYTFASGATYDGEWVANKFEGRGTYQWPSGASYIGDWKENRMHGNGAFLAATGDRFQGKFFNDRFLNQEGHWIAPIQSSQQAVKL